MRFPDYRLFNLSIYILSVLLFTLFYFSFRIYLSNDNHHLEKADLRIMLYAAIGTTFSFAVSLVNNNFSMPEMLITGILLDYTWLKYLISKEMIESN